MIKRFVLLLSSLAVACGEPPADLSVAVASVVVAPAATAGPDLVGDEIRVRLDAVEIGSPDLVTDRPALAPMGRRLAYTVEEPTALPVFILSSYLVEKSAAGVWGSPTLISRGVGSEAPDHITSWFFPSFVPGQQNLLTGIGTIAFDAQHALDFSTLQAGFVHISSTGAVISETVTGAALGFPFGEILQGFRYSPDGRKISFFAQQSPADQGIYVYQTAKKLLHRVSDQHDKDPVWGAGGRGLAFHTEIPLANGTVSTYLGILRLTPGAGDGFTTTRTLLDPVQQGAFHSQEHPAPSPNSDVLFFHGQSATDGSAFLAARRSCVNSRTFKLRVQASGAQLPYAARPTTASGSFDLVFLGKRTLSSRTRVFALAPQQVEAVIALVLRSSSCPARPVAEEPL